LFIGAWEIKLVFIDSIPASIMLTDFQEYYWMAKTWENIKEAKGNECSEMNAVSTKVVLLFFPPVCLFAPSIFSQVTSRHVCTFNLT
jgi:hypothetical protein